MSISAIRLQAQHYIAETKIHAQGRFSTLLPRIAGNINKLIIPLLGLLAMASMPQADAGPMAYGICVEACFVGAGWWCPPLIPVCVVGCLPILAAPTP